jgi:hypothetical protein
MFAIRHTQSAPAVLVDIDIGYRLWTRVDSLEASELRPTRCIAMSQGVPRIWVGRIENYRAAGGVPCGLQFPPESPIENVRTIAEIKHTRVLV